MMRVKLLELFGGGSNSPGYRPASSPSITTNSPFARGSLGDIFYQKDNNPYKKYGGAILRPHGTTPVGSAEQRGVPQTEEDEDIPSRSTPEATNRDKIISNKGRFSTQKKRVYVPPGNVEAPRGA